MTNPIADVGTMLATFIDPTGVEWPMSDTSDDRGYFTTAQIAGWGAPPFEITTDPVPRGGDSVRFIRSKSSRITWPLHIAPRSRMRRSCGGFMKTSSACSPRRKPWPRSSKTRIPPNGTS